MESISRQISSATMSAPSAASRTACARPWPRAAPVLKATLPFRFPTGSAPLVSVGNAAGGNPCLPQAFLRIIDFDVPVAAGARTTEVTIDGQDRLAVTLAARIGDAGQKLQRLFVQGTVVGHISTPRLGRQAAASRQKSVRSQRGRPV